LKQKSQRFWNCTYSFGYLLLYAVSLGLLYKIEHFDVSEPLFVLIVLGVGFSVLAWWTTRCVVLLPLDVKKPGQETMILLAYLVALAIFITWGLPAVGALAPTEPWKSVSILAAKLVAFVVVPMVLFRALGYAMRNFFGTPSQWRQHLGPGLWMALILILFQAVFGRGLSEIRHSGLPARTLLLGVPFTYVWLLAEVGLVEEFFFRCLLQSRLSTVLRSQAGGIVLASLLFGLAHAPGLYLRPAGTQEAVGAHPSWLMAVGYSIMITSVAGVFLGVLWARTRNLILVVAVHAAGDWLPNLVPTIKNWL
jgi:membrane protease YdiL (CAAX protease family)